MAKIPTSLLAFRMARLEVTEYVTRMLMREYLTHGAPEAADVRLYAERVKRHFEIHPPFGIPRPEMVAAIDLFFNTLAAEMKTKPDTR
jgi:hypothetical protein